jgi:hypoxanthine-DNA glycosylase
MKKESEIEIHPFEDFIPPKATHLVLGTFPTLKKNWRFNGYYPGRSNFFWRMLSEIYGVKFNHISGDEAAKERLAICKEYGIAISDTIYRCSRKIATSSKDSDLIVIEKMNILKLLDKGPALNTIILTGSSGKVSAHKLFFEYLSENHIPFQITPSKIPIAGKFEWNNKVINTFTLYSPSGINIGRYQAALQQFREHLPKAKTA